jgi:hypothetical protein
VHRKTTIAKLIFEKPSPTIVTIPTTTPWVVQRIHSPETAGMPPAVMLTATGNPVE